MRLRGERGAGEVRSLVRELTLPVLRTLPWRALAAGGGLGLGLAGLLRLYGDSLAGWSALTLLRTAALAHALGLAFLLDDPARHTTAAVPTRRPLRTLLRVALVTPVTVLWWTAVVLLIPSDLRPPVGPVTLEAGAACALALAAGALAIRLTDEPRPGPSVAAALLFTAVVGPLSLPARWALLVFPQDKRWEASHERWGMVLAATVVVWVACLGEPVRRRRLFRRRTGSYVPSGH
nr:ABC transporter [Streptomyces cylindrosporus]